MNLDDANDAYSRHNLLKLKDGAYLINLDEYKSIGSYWIALCINGDATYFDRFGVKYDPKEMKKIKENQNVTTNIFRTSITIMRGYLCIGFYRFCAKT